MKKPSDVKRASMPRSADYARTFAKDWERLTRAGRFDMPRLKRLMLQLIASGGPLPPEWKDHPLTGEWKDCRDCHVHGDFLLIYRVEGNRVVFLRAGTHADLFE